MNEMVVQVLVMALSYLAVIITTMVVVNWLSNGYLLKYIRVKGSRGRKVLVICDTLGGQKFIVGEVIEDHYLTYKGIDKKQRMWYAERGCFKNQMGIIICEVDEVNNQIRNYETKSLEANITLKRSDLPNLPEGEDDFELVIPYQQKGYIEQLNQDQLDEFYQRCLQRPQLNKIGMIEIVILIAVILSIAVGLFIYYKMTKNHQSVMFMLDSIYNYTVQMQGTIVDGNIIR